jgi:hypothetical protein
MPGTFLLINSCYRVSHLGSAAVKRGERAVD